MKVGAPPRCRVGAFDQRRPPGMLATPAPTNSGRGSYLWRNLIAKYRNLERALARTVVGPICHALIIYELTAGRIVVE